MTWEGQWLSWGFPEGPGHAQGGGSGLRQTRVRGGPCVLERGWGATPPQGGDGGATPPRRPRSRDAVSVGWAGPSTSISPHAESSRSRSAGSTEQREPLHLLTPRPGFFLLSAAAENWAPEHHLFSSLEISVTNGALLQCVIPYPSKFDPVVNFGA